MSKLTPTLPLSGFTQSWSGFALKEHYRGELVSLACVLGQDKAFAAAFEKAFTKPLPAPNHMIEIKGGWAMWSGQGQYMLLLSGDNIRADIEVQTRLNNTAYATLQSDGWVSLDVSGERIYDVLERFIPLDLRRAPHLFATRTSAHHIGVMVLKHHDTRLQLLTPRSSAQSFLDGLVHTANNVLS